MVSDIEAFFDRPRRWQEVSARLRAVLLDCGLDEEFKWRKPCYSSEGNKIVIIQEMKAFVALLFFKGALLTDPSGVLVAQGEHTRSAKRICFVTPAEVAASAQLLRAYVDEAIAVERAGLKVEKPDLVLVEELQARLDEDPTLSAAFFALTPGRQRAYHIEISGAKKSATRAKRVEKYVPRILAGKGLRDR